MNGIDAAALFKAIAERLEKNTNEEFGGVFLIVPPEGGGEPIDGIFLASKPNPVSFWASLNGQVEMAIEEFKAANQPQGHGRGRR
jgi:hypothetical protein